MISIKNACISNSKKDEITNIDFSNGVNFIDYSDRKIFYFLNLKNQYLSSGTFSIDDLNIINENEKTSKLLAFKINSKVLNVLCVFELTDDFKQVGFNSFKQKLISLKPLPLDTEEKKRNKLNCIFETINEFKPLYITIDMNDETNIALKQYICETLQNIEVPYVFVLNQIIQQQEMKETLIEEEIIQNIQSFATHTMTNTPVINDEKNGLVEESMSFEKEFEKFYSIDVGTNKNETGKNTNTQIKQKTNKFSFKDIIKFTRLLILNINLYYVFVFVFSLFVGLGAFCCIYLLRTDHLSIGIILLVLFVLFTFVNLYIYSSTYAGVKKHLDQTYKKVLYVVTFLVTTILGFAASYGGVYLLDSINAFIVLEEFVPNDYIAVLIVLPLQIIGCCLSAPLSILYVKWHKFKIKHITKKDN